MNKVLCSILSALAAIASAPSAEAQAGRSASVEAGKKTALLVCASCHVVASDQEFQPMLNQPAPTFADIANRPDISASSLHRFLTTTHWDQNTLPMSMPSMMLSNEQVADTTSYILSLRKRP